MEFDVIGIFLPPAKLIKAREKYVRSEISSSELKDVVRDSTLDVINQALDYGLKNITSGGFHWKYWNLDFFFGLNGIAKEHFDSGHVYLCEESLTDLMRITGRIKYNPGHPYFEDFRFLAETVNGRAVCRQIIPSPAELYVDILAMTSGHPDRIYPDSDNLLNDITEAYQRTIHHFYELGCRSIVLDDTVCGRLCNSNFTKRVLQGGINLVELQNNVIKLFNDTLSGLPTDLETALYISGGDRVVPEWEYIKYPDNIMPRILAEVDVDKFFLPFDTDDDYSVGILRYVPENKRVVLGLTDAHSPYPDDEEAISEFIAMAKHYIAPSMLAISPRSGFNISSYAPRGLNYNDQWHKIESLSNIASR